MKKSIILVFLLTFLVFLYSKDNLDKKDYSAQQWLEKANRYYLKSKFNEAIECYTAAIEINPDFAEAYYNRGRSYQYINNHEKAIEDFAISINLDKKYYDVLTDNAKKLLINRKFDLAILYLDKAFEIDPKNNYVLFLFGHFYLNKKLYDKSITYFLNAIKLKPDEPGYYFDISEVYFKKRDFYNALDNLTKSINLKENKSAYANRGVIYNAIGSFDKALDDFNRAIEIDKNYVKAIINRSITYYCLNKLNEAKKDSEEVIKLDSNHLYAYFFYFIISNKISIESGQKSLKLLKKNQKKYIKYERPYLIYKYLMGTIDENKLLSYKDISDEFLCEAYTYIGFNYLFKNDKVKAKEYFNKCIKTDIFYFIEYVIVKNELNNF